MPLLKRSSAGGAAAAVARKLPDTPNRILPVAATATKSSAAHVQAQAGTPLFNRELSWIRFNQRVIEEAADRAHPLLERLKFVAIFSSNLDEFFQIRVAGVKEQINAEIVERTLDGLSPTEQLAQINELLHPLVEMQSKILSSDILPKLRAKGVSIVAYNRLDEEQRGVLSQVFAEKIFPILTPLAIDPAHPFPKLRGLALNLLVTLRSPGRRAAKKIAVVPIPTALPRFYPFIDKAEGKYQFVLLEQIIEAHLEMLFPNMKIVDVSTFRLTRNADLDISEAEADDLLKLIERELRKRRLGAVIRLEVQDDVSETGLEYLMRALDLTEQEVYRISGILGLESLWKLIERVDLPDLRDEPFTPALHPVVAEHDSIFDAITEQDMLFHHPYDSFHPVVEMLEEAAEDPRVVAIKQTLYRPSGRSAIALALKEAALNGKQVTVLIELKARFDEETNIQWAKELERVGCNVVYGMIGLKIHGKMTLILRQEEAGLQYYTHLSTGNYNERTATLYTDVGLMTANRAIGQDVSELFNLLTGYSGQEQWREIFVAPITMRAQFQALVQACIDQHTPETPSRIRLVMNSLVDPEMIAALYAASRAGVRVECVIRGICCLVPGVPGTSENIVVRSIVGRFLEHVRIYYFESGGSSTIYCGSADWMQRNLTRRVEVAFPIRDPKLKLQLTDVLETMFEDTEQARLLRPDGTYVRVNELQTDPKDRFSAQEHFLSRARARQRLVDTTHTSD
jgi:polyphosphate kinase